ncbi:MAG TPA: ATP-binding cassette domain-containing protein [Mycobacteriales bacterium]
MIALDHVCLWVAGPPRVDLLRDVTWSVRRGEHWAVLGPNGAGKTSLLSVLSANRHPSSGTADVLGARLGRVDMRALRERIAVVDAPTGARLPRVLTLHDVALTGATGTVLPRYDRYDDGDHERADAELRVVGLERLRDRRFGDCSHGERARALLARALVQQPDLLLLDEASGGLDLPAREALLAAVAGACRGRAALTSVTVTHHLEELPPTTTHALLLREASVVAAGPVAEVLTDAAMSQTFGLPVRVHRDGGRWSATAAGSWRP